MSDTPSLRPICLLGPPAVGKTTLAERLGRALPAPVYQPRSLVQRAIGNEPAVMGLFQRDHHGFVPDEALGYALRCVLDHIRGLVVLENLPWNALQLADLHRLAGHNIVLVNLKASDELVLRRRDGRRYCPQCYPLPPAVGPESSCIRCGANLVFRSDDEGTRFAERLALRRMHTDQILLLARRLGVSVVELDAAIGPAELTQLLLEAVHPSASGTASIPALRVRPVGGLRRDECRRTSVFNDDTRLRCVPIGGYGRRS